MKRSLAVAVLAAAAGHALLFVLWLTSASTTAVLLAWLAAALVVIGICSGTQAIRCIHGLTGGRWMEVLDPPLGNFASIAPIVTLPLLVLLFFAPQIFPWAGDLPHETAHVIRKKDLYLNVPFLIVRTAAFVAVTALLAVWSRQTMSASRSAIGMILWLLAVSVLAIDWVMSLRPAWFSTAIGLWLASSFVLSALAATAAASAAARRTLAAARRNDVAILLLAAALFWFYVSFMQYLVIWSGNLPEEIGWFVERRTPYWTTVSLLMTGLLFAVPLVALVLSPARRSRAMLVTIAAMVLIGRVLESEWQIQPAAPAPAGLQALAAAAALLGLGGFGAAALITFGSRDGPGRAKQDARAGTPVGADR